MPWTTGLGVWNAFTSSFRSKRDRRGVRQVVRKERPTYHVMPKSGWMNDPNGPIFYEGKYHLFYQHVPGKSVWDFGIVWGHASSKDLVTWEHHPHALEPVEGSLDADGCFSGCCILDKDGTPTILYTGVRKRVNPNCGPLPPPEHDLNLEFIESQCAAVAQMGSDDLVNWEKQSVPAIPLPPKNLPLVGWRDPFVIQKDDSEENWTMLMGSGMKDQGGAVMVYKSTSPTSGWYFDGFLCSGNGDTGAMWECPLLAKLPIKDPAPTPVKFRMARSTSVGSNLFDLNREDPFENVKSRRSHSVDVTAIALEKSFQIPSAVEHIEEEGRQHFFCISPDAKENRVVYWLGDYRDGKFIIEDAKGPFFLDMGDVVYAPNILQDDKGRQILWGWIRDFEIEEAPIRGEQDYSGCLSTPRVLSITNGRLIQEPAPEVANMRGDNQWHIEDAQIFSDIPTPVEIVGGQAIDLELTVKRGLSSCTGLVLQPFEKGHESAAIMFDWDTSMLEVIVNPSKFSPSAAGTRRTGGKIDMKHGDSLDLRILIDYSSIEIFVGTGEVVTTRVYRGTSAMASDARIDLMSTGGNSHLVKAAVYEVNSIWGKGKEIPAVVEEQVAAAPPLAPAVGFSWWPSWTAVPALS